MDPFSRNHRTLGNSMIADSDSSEDSDAKPFSPAGPDRNHYLPEIVSEGPGSAVSRKISDGFREVEISSQAGRFTPDRRKENALQTVAEANSGLLNSSVIFAKENSYDNETFEIDEEGSVDPKGGRESYEVAETPFTRKERKERRSKKHSTGLVLDKLKKDDFRKRLVKPIDDDDLTKKYGVSMSVKSGVMRTPWRRGGSSEESNGDCSGSNGKGSESLKRSSTEETVLPSTSSSADSVLRSKDLLDEDAITPAEEEVEAEGSTENIIATISHKTEEKEKQCIHAVSIATYNNIQKKEIFKRGNCILCVTATITFIVTIILTVAILIAPKNLTNTESQKPRGIVLANVSGADAAVVKAFNRPSGLLHKSWLVSPVNKTLKRTENLVSKNMTLPKR